MVVVSYCRGRPRLVLVNRLEGLNLPRNSTTINWPARHDLVVAWAIKPQHNQIKKQKRQITQLIWAAARQNQQNDLYTQWRLRSP